VRVFDKNYKNPRIYTFNTSFEQEFLKNLSGYVDFTWSRGVYLTNFVNLGRSDRAGSLPFSPTLGDIFVTGSNASSLYRGIVFGARLRPTRGFTLDGNYTYSIDRDNDSNERDPFNDFSGGVLPGEALVNPSRDWGYSDRDIRHKFNLVMSSDLPFGFKGNLRVQAHSAQPLSIAGDPGLAPRIHDDGGTLIRFPRNTLRRDNAYSTIDWRLARPFKFGERYALTPMVEMFNSYNSKNNVNTLSTPDLFDFNGFLRRGVGDPRQVQLAIKFTF
jgi:hypothetical protein